MCLVLTWRVSHSRETIKLLVMRKFEYSEERQYNPVDWQPTRFLCLWDSPGKNIGVASCSLLQGICLIQGLNPGIPHCRLFFFFNHWSHQEAHKQFNKLVNNGNQKHLQGGEAFQEGTSSKEVSNGNKTKHCFTILEVFVLFLHKVYSQMEYH